MFFIIPFLPLIISNKNCEAVVIHGTWTSFGMTKFARQSEIRHSLHLPVVRSILYSYLYPVLGTRVMDLLKTFDHERPIPFLILPYLHHHTHEVPTCF